MPKKSARQEIGREKAKKKLLAWKEIDDRWWAARNDMHWDLEEVLLNIDGVEHMSLEEVSERLCKMLELPTAEPGDWLDNVHFLEVIDITLMNSLSSYQRQL